MTANTPNKMRMLGVEDLRETNELKLLHIIRDRQPISRADLVKATGLRAGTVSVIVNRLLRSAVVNEGEEAPSSGGRPATYLQLNSEKAHVVGMNIGVHQTIFGVSDFNGRISKQRTLTTGSNAGTFLRFVADEIGVCFDAYLRRGKVGAIGVSIPGLIDRIDGCLVRSPNLRWQDVPVKTILEDKLGVPVVVENDANAAAFSELWYGPMEVWGAHCILFLLVVEGIGTGLVLNGEVYGGSRIGMGGFGHIAMDPNGLMCSCGNRGCWETVASDDATLKRYLASEAGAATSVRSLDDLIALAFGGDERAREELITTARSLGRGIKGLAQGLAPEVIVVGGKITAAWSLIEPVIVQEVQSEYFVPGISKPEVRRASVDQPSFFGAFPVALRHILSTRKPVHALV